MKIFKILLSLALIFVSILTIQAIVPHSEFIIYGGLILTTPAAAGVYPVNLNYIPQFLIYDAAAAPLTNLRVSEALDGTYCDLALAGIAQVRNYMRFGLPASTVTKIRLANGHIKNKNLTITLTQPGAVAIAVQACSDCPGTVPFKYTTAALLAGQPYKFTDFTCLFLPALAAADTVLVQFANGHSQLFDAAELLELSALYQNQQLATGFQLNNINSYIKWVEVTQAAAGAAYVMAVDLKR